MGILYPKGLVRQQRPLRWYHGVPRYCRSNAERNHCFGSIHHESQDHLPTRKEILRLDWWFHLGLPLHLPGFGSPNKNTTKQVHPSSTENASNLLITTLYYAFLKLFHSLFRLKQGFYLYHQVFPTNTNQLI